MADIETPKRTITTANSEEVPKTVQSDTVNVTAGAAASQQQGAPKAEEAKPEMTEAQFEQGVEKYAAEIVNSHPTLADAQSIMKQDIDKAVEAKTITKEAGEDLKFDIDVAVAGADGKKEAFPAQLADQLADNKDNFVQILQRDQAGGEDMTSNLQNMGAMGIIIALISAFTGQGNVDIERLLQGFIEKKDPDKPLIAQDKGTAQVAAAPKEQAGKPDAASEENKPAQEEQDSAPAQEENKPDRIEVDGPTRLADGSQAGPTVEAAAALADDQKYADTQGYEMPNGGTMHMALVDPSGINLPSDIFDQDSSGLNDPFSAATNPVDFVIQAAPPVMTVDADLQDKPAVNNDSYALRA